MVRIIFPTSFWVDWIYLDTDDNPSKDDNRQAPSTKNATESTNPSSLAPLFVQVSPSEFKGYTENEGFSDDDSDDETTVKPSAKSGDSVAEKRKTATSIAAIVSNPNSVSKYSKKIKPVREDVLYELYFFLLWYKSWKQKSHQDPLLLKMLLPIGMR